MSGTADTSNETHDAGAKQRVTLIGGAINLVLGLGKIVVGFIGQSQALIVDGIHSLSDLVSDGIVLLACSYGSRDADGDHPYGHGRIETVASAGVGAMLLLVAGGFIYDAIQRLLIDPDALLVPGWLALSVACASIVIKEGLYHYTRVVAKQARSRLLEVNAWHHRSDALSSLVVVGGIAGVLMGLPWLDAVAAIIVAIMLAHVGLQFAWQSLRELVDTALTPEEIADIESVVRDIDGVRDVHGLRTRRMGQDALADLHVVVDPRLSVSEGHRISEEVHDRLMRDIRDVNDVLVHIEHEDPVFDEATFELPLRRDVERDLNDCWADMPAARSIERMDLHYMEGALEVEIHLPWQPDRDPAAIRRELDALARQAESLGYVSTCRIHFVGR
ncbi:cation diffusion facilitator family transporter [Aquisalimonas asiatica]|uniref:Cation diffusion facilitator family transporter n=1 Tax=Aquisalimonas asiatica TaxID=406100 RepID=A0A1H8QP69_9GAMM|nr:cation diffusion facilitator family transporter [Aquisalimonas asiatica]SEO55836.1 cation diffusion facilitator family transporter [Aquisalimonas asiatica]